MFREKSIAHRKDMIVTSSFSSNANDHESTKNRHLRYKHRLTTRGRRVRCHNVRGGAFTAEG
jgi:hypothetical protein